MAAHIMVLAPSATFSEFPCDISHLLAPSTNIKSVTAPMTPKAALITLPIITRASVVSPCRGFSKQIHPVGHFPFTGVQSCPAAETPADAESENQTIETKTKNKTKFFISLSKHRGIRIEQPHSWQESPPPPWLPK